MAIDPSIRAYVKQLEDPDPTVRVTAAKALGGLPKHTGYSRAKNQEDHEASVNGLRAALTDPDHRVRAAAAEGLRAHGSSLAHADLFSVVTRRREAARQAAADALLFTTPLKEPSRLILQGLEHPDRRVRLSVMRAMLTYIEEYLGHSLYRGWLHSLLKLGDDPDKTGEVSAVVNRLAALMDDPDPLLREAAAAALVGMRQVLQYWEREATVEDDDDGGGGTEGPYVRTRFTKTFAAAEQARPRPRYADLTFYNEKRQGLGLFEALQAERRYLLEVAVRSNPQGIRPAQGARKPVAEPRTEAPVKITVTVEGDSIEVEEPVQSLVLPVAGDSLENAVFHIRPLPPPGAKDGEAELHVRLYCGLNLLESIVVRAQVTKKFSDRYQYSGKSITFVQERLERGYVDLQTTAPRMMHIDLTRTGAAYQFTFALQSGQQHELILTAPVRLSTGDLEDELAGIRKLWYGIAMSGTFTQQLEGRPDEFVAHMRRLAKAGRSLWVKLFKGEVNSAIYKIGEWLEEHPLPEGAFIQVSADHEAASFVFPWALLYDRPVPRKEYELPDPNGFWGVRYCIEQRAPGSPAVHDTPSPREDPLNVAFLLWDQFRNAHLENELMGWLQAHSQGRVKVTHPPITDAETAYELLGEGEADIFYFYTHGHTHQNQAGLKSGAELELFTTFYRSLEPGSPLAAAYQPLYESIQRGIFERDRSWIELTYGKLYLEELKDYVLRLRRAPLVVLNMCESAQVVPSLTDSFVHFFLNRGAYSVLGTECPMTVEFAHPFAEILLKSILAGQKVGEALRSARRHFLALRNPLGLAYTLFGSAMLCFDPPRLTLPPEQPP